MVSLLQVKVHGHQWLRWTALHLVGTWPLRVRAKKCKCRACLQKFFFLCMTDQVCKSHVRVCPVPGLKASSVYSVFRCKFSPRLY